jgi:AraC-like DNA-binding protein
MITTSEIAPSPALAPFVHSYAFREFETGGVEIVMPWRASSQSNIIFFFKDVPVKLTSTATGQVLKRGKSCDMVGMSTQYNGDMFFNGSYAFFQILFRPHGFYTLFNSSPVDIVEKIVWSGDVFNSEIHLLHEQLYEAKSVLEMAERTNTWLLRHLNKNKRADYKNCITVAANLIIQNGGLINLDRLANDACMSMRNFERVFLNETGMTPKQLCCISRFNHALELKLNHPNLKWTSIAQEAAYFDQMHLVKDFKRFCGEAPASLLKHVPMLEEKYISRVNH